MCIRDSSENFRQGELLFLHWTLIYWYTYKVMKWMLDNQYIMMNQFSFSYIFRMKIEERFEWKWKIPEGFIKEEARQWIRMDSAQQRHKSPTNFLIVILFSTLNYFPLGELKLIFTEITLIKSAQVDITENRSYLSWSFHHNNIQR